MDDSQLLRYSRHILLDDIGIEGQQRLLGSHALMIGAGGLGSPVALYLGSAGVGRITIVDHDSVDLTNLQRQIVHVTERVGQPKTASVVEAIRQLNPHVMVHPYAERISTANAMEIIPQYDIVADGCDNFPTRFLVSDACYFAEKPLVSAAVGQFDGQISTFKPYLKTPEGEPFPTYRCLIGELPERGLFPACEEVGILGALPGIIGSMQAMEVLKEILAIGDSLAGRLLMYDALGSRLYETQLTWNPDNPLTGHAAQILDLRPENYKA